MINRFGQRIGMLSAVALFGLALSLSPTLAAGGGGGGGGEGGIDSRYPKPPAGDTNNPNQKSTSKKKQKTGQDFRDGYGAARALVLDGKYEEAIAAFHELGDDEHPDIANYIGYAERKLGHYQASKYWYEVALTSDPNHVRTLNYYGMWHVEQGNMLKAQDFLEKIRLICGDTTCREYRDLKGVMDGTISY